MSIDYVPGTAIGIRFFPKQIFIHNTKKIVK